MPKNQKIEKALVMLHGFGADGNDLISMAPFMEQHLSNTVFYAPNAPEQMENTAGFKWFDIEIDASTAVFTHSDYIERLMQRAKESIILVNDFIKYICLKHNLKREQIVLMGFSQGGLIALITGLLYSPPLAGLIGCSAVPVMINNALPLEKIKVKPSVLLTHGTDDDVVPFMAIAYIIGALVIMFSNIESLGAMFASIFKFAFTSRALGGGVVGTVILGMTQGFKRGVFSNEAGLGSSVMVHSSSNVKEPVRQGMWGIFEVFFDTMIVCTMTAIVVLSSGHINLTTGVPNEGISDATLVSQVFGDTFGVAGTWFVAIAMLLFAFTTVLGWSQYGSKAVEYLFGVKAVKVYKVIFVLMIVSGAIMESSLAWDISDTFNGLMMIPNLIGVLAMFPLVVKITKNYVNRKIKHKDEAPVLSYDPAIQAEMEADLDE